MNPAAASVPSFQDRDSLTCSGKLARRDQARSPCPNNDDVLCLRSSHTLTTSHFGRRILDPGTAAYARFIQDDLIAIVVEFHLQIE